MLHETHDTGYPVTVQPPSPAYLHSPDYRLTAASTPPDAAIAYSPSSPARKLGIGRTTAFAEIASGKDQVLQGRKAAVGPRVGDRRVHRRSSGRGAGSCRGRCVMNEDPGLPEWFAMVVNDPDVGHWQSKCMDFTRGVWKLTPFSDDQLVLVGDIVRAGHAVTIEQDPVAPVGIVIVMSVDAIGGGG